MVSSLLALFGVWGDFGVGTTIRDASMPHANTRTHMCTHIYTHSNTPTKITQAAATVTAAVERVAIMTA